MAAPALVERLSALVGSLGKALPFLKPKVLRPEGAHEPFDSLEDGTTVAPDDFEPNAALDISGVKGSRGERGGGGGLKAFLEAILQSRILLGTAMAILVFILALAAVAILINVPPAKAKAGPARAGQPASGSEVSPEGPALLRRLILPRGPDNAPRVELEREPSRVYTVEDLSAFSTDPGSIDISGLKAANEAGIRALYGTVP